MSIEIKEGFYHRLIGPGLRESISFRNEAAGYTITRARFRQNPAEGLWDLDGPTHTLLTGASRSEATRGLVLLLSEGEWRWSDVANWRKRRPGIAE